MVRVVGVEPTRLAAQEPKSCASANSAIPAYIYIIAKHPAVVQRNRFTGFCEIIPDFYVRKVYNEIVFVL